MYLDDNTVQIDNDQIEKVGYNHFVITENDQTFELEYFVESNIIEINDQFYDLDDYLEAIDNETYTVNEALPTLEPLEVENPPIQTPDFQTNLPNQESVISPMSTPPTTGYGELQHVGNRSRVNMTIATTTAAITAIMAFLFPGAAIATGTSFVNSILSQAVSAGLIAAGVNVVTGDLYVSVYQAFHNTEIGAVREQRLPYAEVENHTFYGEVYDRFFWSVRP